MKRTTDLRKSQLGAGIEDVRAASASCNDGLAWSAWCSSAKGGSSFG